MGHYRTTHTGSSDSPSNRHQPLTQLGDPDDLHAAHSLYNFGPMAATYDQWYATAEGKRHDDAQRAALRRLLPPMKPGARLLEVGCGTGHWSRIFAGLGYEVTGVDISPEMILTARSYHTPNCQFELADACRLPSVVRKYNVVAAMATLEFIDDQPGAIAGMARCRADDGILLVGTLNERAPLNRDRVAKGIQPYASGHLLTPAALYSLLRPYGQVSFAEADSSAPSASGLLARIRKSIRLHAEHSSAPFIIAMAQHRTRR